MSNALNTTSSSKEKDLPLKEDIRFLGRILGDVVREQEGDEVFDLVETIRKSSIAYLRDTDTNTKAGFESILNGLTPAEAVQVVRAFSYFSHLANMAEDQHHIRRTRAHELAGSPARNGTIDKAFERATAEGATAESLIEFFNEAHVGAVLTAHPTEIRRQSTMRREISMAKLLSRRDRGGLTASEEAEIDNKLKRAIIILWQTNLLRQTKLDVIDEVTNGLSYYDHSFFKELPKLYATIEDDLSALNGSSDTIINSFFNIGSWIGGDRDGNPFVNADVMAKTMRKQSVKAIEFYLEQLHKLGGELSLSTRIVDVSDELKTLAEQSGDESPHRGRELYRRAIVGMYNRLAATLVKIDKTKPSRVPLAKARPYKNSGQLIHDLDVIRTSLLANTSKPLTRGRLRHLRRAVDCFGF